jgi:hypothetical protein
VTGLGLLMCGEGCSAFFSYGFFMVNRKIQKKTLFFLLHFFFNVDESFPQDLGL